jgi:hypothetical protein
MIKYFLTLSICLYIDICKADGDMLERLAETLLLQVKKEEDYTQYWNLLSEISLLDLTGKEGFKHEDEKNAFWINIYNAAFQIRIKEDTTNFYNKKLLFSEKFIHFKDFNLSLDNIEHGILRHSEWKYGRGLIKQWFPSKTIKSLQIQKPDYRIHFTLNCGAMSCPPIAFYMAVNLENDFSLAEENYVISTSKYDDSKDVVYISKIFSWYKRDFGGKKGIKNLLLQYKVIPTKDVKIKYTPFNFDMLLSQYK